MQLIRPFGTLLLLTSVTMCGGNTATSGSCTPGQSIACTGPGGCSSNQVCNTQGTAYGACVCAGSPDAGTHPTDSGHDAPGGDARKDASHGADARDTGMGSDSADSAPSKDAGCPLTPSWDPSMLAGLALWLNDAKGIVVDSSGHVAHWVDQSGHGNEATPMLLNNGPMTVDPGVVNGLDAVVNSGGGAYLQVLDGPSVQFGTSGFMFGIVMRTQSGALVFPVTKDIMMGNGLVITYGSTAINFALGSQSIVITPADRVHFHYMIASAQKMTLDSDGVSSVTGPTSTVDVSNPGATLNVFSDAAAMGVGKADEVAEVVMAKGPISCSDIANLAAYFKTKFAL